LKNIYGLITLLQLVLGILNIITKQRNNGRKTKRDKSRRIQKDSSILRELFLDTLWNENIGPISFAHPYVEVVFEKELYDEIEGVKVTYFSPAIRYTP